MSIPLTTIVIVAIPIILYFLKGYDYLIFHVGIEFFAILVSFYIFYLLITNTSHDLNAFLIITGVAYLFVGITDTLHTLTYKGMGIFPVNELNVATQFWIVARIIETSAYTAGVFLSGKTISKKVTLIIYGTATTIVTAMILFTDLFPTALAEGEGLTPFKIYTEYVIIAVLLITIMSLYRLHGNFSFRDHILLTAAIGVTILSEFSFTLYNDVYGIMNMMGHYLKAISFTIILLAYRNLYKTNQYEN